MNVFIGLEIHLQLKTNTKLFCGCSNSTCPVCLGYPGTMPSVNKEAIRLAGVLASGLKATLQDSKFERKHYFYFDSTKNYQTTPIMLNGQIEIDEFDFPTDARPKSSFDKIIRLHHAHVEEDVGKLTHFSEHSVADYRRGGLPILEIVTLPEIKSPEETVAVITSLCDLAQRLGVSTARAELGEIRVDCNISVSHNDELGVKVELKNMNSLSAIRKALAFEIKRQTDNYGSIIQETRRWDDKTNTTEAMREKENAMDYRYMPEPNLGVIQKIVEKYIPETPKELQKRLVSNNVSRGIASVIAKSETLSHLFYNVVVDDIVGFCKLLANDISAAMKEHVVEVHHIQTLMNFVKLHKFDKNALAQILSGVTPTASHVETLEDLQKV